MAARITGMFTPHRVPLDASVTLYNIPMFANPIDVPPLFITHH